MSKLKSFLKGNAKVSGNVSLPLDRYDDPIILRRMGSKEGDAIKDLCFVNKVGMKGKQERVFDGVKFTRELNIASIVFPDLNDAELQGSYGVRGAEELYHELFYLDETNQISEKITEIGEVDKTINEDIAEAKN